MAAKTMAECCCEDNARANKQAVYQSHTTYIGTTARHIGPFYALTALTDTIIDVSECDTGIIEFASGVKRPTETNISIPQGMTIYGDFKSIEIDSGEVLVYSRGIAGEAREPTADPS
jgi:uncharacterized oligopeptide transporter (OPT) family protein